MNTEQIQWVPTNERNPDSDFTVLLFDATASESVWHGYLDGEQWRYADGMPANPTAWARFPIGPAFAVPTPKPGRRP